MAPLAAELWLCWHSLPCPAECQKAQAGAAGRSVRSSLAFWVQGGRLAGLQQGMGASLWLWWAERGRTWVFEGLVEGTGPLLELEMGRKTLAGVPVYRGGHSRPGGLSQGQPSWKQASLC